MPALLLSSNYSRSTYTLSGLVDRVKGDLAYSSNNFITSGNIKDWANEAQMVLARDTRAFHITVTSGVTSGTMEYPIPSEAVGKALTIEEVTFSGTPVPNVSINWLYSNNAYWKTAPAASKPYCYYQRGFSVIGIYPAPNADSADALSITVTALPPDVTEPEDQYYVPHGVEDAIIIYCKLQASLKDAFGEGKARIDYYRNEWQLAQRRAQEVAASINENETVRYGENAVLYGSGLDPFFTTAETLATPL